MKECLHFFGPLQRPAGVFFHFLIGCRPVQRQLGKPETGQRFPGGQRGDGKAQAHRQGQRAFFKNLSSLLFNFHHQANPALVAAAFKFSGQENIHNPLGQHGPGDARPQGQHIGVVVPAGELGGEHVTAQGAADAVHLVGRDGDADSGSADNDALFAPALRHRLGGGLAEDGVVAAVDAVGAEVLAGNSLSGQIGLEVLLELVAAVVRRNGDHKQFLL